jgi:hypothetical protein
MASATGEFEIAGWEEETYSEIKDGAKLTRAAVTQTFRGDVTGTAEVQWLMSYQPSGTARYVGLMLLEGSVGGRSGSFVAETSGDFDGGKATGTWSVLAGVGTGGLAGLRGEGRFEAPPGSTADYAFEYSFE